jgi:hypothetical protein
LGISVGNLCWVSLLGISVGYLCWVSLHALVFRLQV